MQNPKFQLFMDEAGEYRFRLTARNGETILSAAQGYVSRHECIIAIESVKVISPYDRCYSRKMSPNNLYHFTIQAGNGEVLGISELFNDYFSRENSISSVKSNAPFAGIEDLATAFSNKVPAVS